MAFDIDMKSYAGANDSAAASQPVDTNSYQQDGEEYPVNQELLDQPLGNPEQLSNQDQSTEEGRFVQTESKQELNFKALREEVDRIKAEKDLEKREHQLQLEMLKANIAQQHYQKPQDPDEHRVFKGMNDDDIPNVSDFRKEWEQREAIYQGRLQELEFQSSHPDYAEVLNKYLTPLVREKPFLAREIQNSANPSALAYEMAKLAQERQVIPEAPKSNHAQKIVDNARKPGTLSQAGGQNVLGKADYYATMSDQEFHKFASRHLEGI